MFTEVKKHYYITDPFYNTVKDSQVTNWLEVVGREGFVFDLIIVTPVTYVIKNNKLRKQKIAEVKKLLKGKVIQVYVLKSKDSSGISTLIKIIYFLFIFSKDLIKKNKIIVQTRSLNNVSALSLIKRIAKVSIIFDCRGAASEEYINGLGYNNIDVVTERRVLRNYNKILNQQIMFFANSDAICVISHQLASYINRISCIDYSPKIHVVPGAADERHFFFDQVLREKARKDLGFSEQTKVFVYTGKLDSHWHMKEFMFRVMAELTKKSDESFFLCITPETNLAEKLMKQYAIPKQKVLIRKAPYSKINKYLCAADFGLLFRENIATNNVASPTKLPEYLLAGLPVIISEGVGDYSLYIKNTGYGICVENSSEAIMNKLISISTITEMQRYSISNNSHKKFSKQAHVETLIKIFQSF